jgi:hypothetical protein
MYIYIHPPSSTFKVKGVKTNNKQQLKANVAYGWILHLVGMSVFESFHFDSTRLSYFPLLVLTLTLAPYKHGCVLSCKWEPLSAIFWSKNQNVNEEEMKTNLEFNGEGVSPIKSKFIVHLDKSISIKVKLKWPKRKSAMKFRWAKEAQWPNVLVHLTHYIVNQLMRIKGVKYTTPMPW